MGNNTKTLYLMVLGCRLEIEWYEGVDKGPTLILLHEGLGCIEMWRDFPKKLSDAAGLSVLVYSRQGYGRSDACTLPRPLTYMHLEALEVLPELLKVADIQDHVLIGHSDGGSIALINGGGSPSTGLQAIVTMAPHVLVEAITLKSIAASTVAYTEGNLRASLDKYHNNVDCTFWGWNHSWLNPDFANWNIESYLPGVKVPQLVIQGTEDPYGTSVQLESIAEGSGSSVRVNLIDNCCHSPYKEKPLECLEVIGNFLEALSLPK